MVLGVRLLLSFYFFSFFFVFLLSYNGKRRGGGHGGPLNRLGRMELTMSRVGRVRLFILLPPALWAKWRLGWCFCKEALYSPLLFLATRGGGSPRVLCQYVPFPFDGLSRR